MAPLPAWPLPFTVAVGAFRTILRHFPQNIAESSFSTQSFLQPVTNNVGWPAQLLPQEVTVKSDVVRGVRGEWYLPKASASEADGREEGSLLLWAHGGGFAFCSPGTHRMFLARVAALTGVRVFCVDYRKPPDHPFPVPVEDVMGAFRVFQDPGLSERLFLGGDSAGGNLALAATRAMIEPSVALRPPEGLVLLSPWVDLSDAGKGWKHNKVDYIPANLAQVVAKHYAGSVPLDDARVSPALSDDWRAFPRVLLDYGGNENFRPQIERMQAAMLRGGVDVDSRAEEGMIHGYPLWEFAWGNGPGPFEKYFDRLRAFLRR